MMIEITHEDLAALAEAAKANTGSLMLMLKTTDRKLVQLVVTAPERRKRRSRAVAGHPAASEASAD